MMTGFDITSSRQAALTGKSNRSDVLSLDAEIRRLEILVDDLFWNNETERGLKAQEELDYLRSLHLSGERFYYLF
jgi:hypothetical protein